MGRPTKYTQTLADLICARIATHDIGLARLSAKYDDMPSKDTVNEWRFKYPDFSAKYARAKLLQADLLAESIDDIASESLTFTDTDGNTRHDAGFIADKRLRIDTRKWLASKLLPRAYGERVQHDATINVVSHEQSLAALE